MCQAYNPQIDYLAKLMRSRSVSERSAPRYPQIDHCAGEFEERHPDASHPVPFNGVPPPAISRKALPRELIKRRAESSQTAFYRRL
jgi:hypothetical protein